MARPHRLALTPDQIQEARALRATRTYWLWSWPCLARRYGVSVNQVRYALDADRQRERAKERHRRWIKKRGGDRKEEYQRLKAKAAALGFRSVYQMRLVLSGKAPPPKPKLTMQVPWAVPQDP